MRMDIFLCTLIVSAQFVPLGSQLLRFRVTSWTDQRQLQVRLQIQ